MSTTHLDGTVRAEIAASWRRSVGHGLVPHRLTVPYQAEVDGGRLERAARPVADQLSEDLAGTGVSLVLSDEQALIIDRRVPDRDMRPVFDRIPLAPGCRFGEESIGTNALGMALRQESPALVAGEEHFTDTLASLMCSAAPVIDPATGRMLGAVGLTTGAQADSSLMVPFVRRAGREVEQRLVEGISVADRVLFEHFLRARRRAKGPLVSVNERIMHANTAAAGLTSAADRAPLWDWAMRVMSAAAAADPVIRLTSGIDVTARARPVHDGDLLAGVLVRLDPGPARAAAPPRGAQARGAAVLGWASLTPTEHSVADVVAQGTTNREAAARLFLSPHTVDFHLRQIFRKLGIGSRVELARVVLQHDGGSDRGPPLAGSLDVRSCLAGLTEALDRELAGRPVLGGDAHRLEDGHAAPDVGAHARRGQELGDLHQVILPDAAVLQRGHDVAGLGESGLELVDNHEAGLAEQPRVYLTHVQPVGADRVDVHVPRHVAGLEQRGGRPGGGADHVGSADGLRGRARRREHDPRVAAPQPVAQLLAALSAPAVDAGLAYRAHRAHPGHLVGCLAAGAEHGQDVAAGIGEQVRGQAAGGPGAQCRQRGRVHLRADAAGRPVDPQHRALDAGQALGPAVLVQADDLDQGAARHVLGRHDQDPPPGQ
jgi:DNA-binding CsgD family transcriptional regulator